MEISRKRLAEIIREEIEEASKPKKGKRKGPEQPGVASADTEPVRQDDTVADGGTVKGPDPNPVPPSNGPSRRLDASELDVAKNGPARAGDEREQDGSTPASNPGDEETGDPDEEHSEQGDEAESGVQDGDDEGDPEPSGAVNDEVSGKTVQAVTIEPKSKVLPGAKEVVLSFNESTDALRILITSTGMVKFFWKGQLHDLP